MQVERGMIGRPTGLLFDPQCDYTYCRICGEIFQGNMERNPQLYLAPWSNYSPAIVAEAAKDKRRSWSQLHAATHTPAQHRELQESGLWLMPDAAHKLAPFGIFNLVDAVVNEEVRQALETAPRAPVNDAIST